MRTTSPDCSSAPPAHLPLCTLKGLPCSGRGRGDACIPSLVSTVSTAQPHLGPLANYTAAAETLSSPAYPRQVRRGCGNCVVRERAWTDVPRGRSPRTPACSHAERADVI